MIFAGFAFSPVTIVSVLFVPAGISAIGAILAFNIRTDVVFDASDHRIYVTSRDALRDCQKIWYPYSSDQLRVEKFWCADKFHGYKNFFVVLTLPGREIPIFQHPQQDVVQQKLSQIVDLLA